MFLKIKGIAIHLSKNKNAFTLTIGTKKQCIEYTGTIETILKEFNTSKITDKKTSDTISSKIKSLSDTL